MFVLSSNRLLEPELSSYDRLYAFPNKPIINDSNFIILDSGAYGLSFSGKKMDAKYMQRLAMHYEKYAIQENIACISADVFKYPELTMRQHEYFSSICRVEVSPVIQFSTKTVDLFSAKKQVRFYNKHNPNLKMICISNHQFDINKQCSDISKVVDVIRSAWSDDIKIHVLGAGFNSRNVAKWMSAGITSMDSISYYTDAQYKQQWRFGVDRVEPSNLKFKQLALYNADIAVSSASNFRSIL